MITPKPERNALYQRASFCSPCCSSREHSAGLRVNAFSEENTTATQIVTANCRYISPVIPGSIATGTNTASSTSVVAIMAPPTSCMVTSAASLGVMVGSWRRWRSQFSITRMASSTTIPMARIRPNRVTVLIDMPIASNTANVAISDTGIATEGTSVARQLPRNTKVIAITRPTAWNSEMITWLTAVDT